MTTTTFSIARITVLSAVVASLAACGGGGSAGGVPVTVPVIAPSPSPVVLPPSYSEPQSISTIPALSYVNQSRADVLNRLNAIRASVGLGLIAQQAQLDTAAQAHSDYLVANNQASHFETSGTTGFTGNGPGDRATAAGYVWKTVNEVISYSGAGAAAVDSLMSVPYHRLGMLQYGWTAVGVGSTATTDTFNPFDVTIDMAFAPSGPQGAPNTPAVVMPIDGGSGIPVSMMRNESPNPIPENNGVLAGYPVSLQVNETKTLTVSSFTLSLADGTLVSTKLLDPATDTNLLASGFKFFACALPRSPLAANTTYYAKFVGTVNGAAFSKSWSFRTAP